LSDGDNKCYFLPGDVNFAQFESDIMRSITFANTRMGTALDKKLPGMFRKLFNGIAAKYNLLTIQ